MDEMENYLGSIGMEETKQITWSRFLGGEITFDLTNQVLRIEKCNIGKSTLKALIRKCKDLGWLDEDEGVDESEN